MINPLIDILQCPQCCGELNNKQDELFCIKCSSVYLNKEGIIDFIDINSMDKSLKLTFNKYNKTYSNYSSKIKAINKRYEEYKRRTMPYVDCKNLISNLNCSTIMEIGCGECFWATTTGHATNKWMVYIDISMASLKNAKRLAVFKGVKGIFLRADIRRLPLKEHTIDLIYGGGVIEHFENTNAVVKELFRVTNKGGVVINTVPVISLFTLTYNQQWGSIPNLPVLKQIFNFIHTKLLKGKHIYYGYELLFTERQLNRIFNCFDKVEIRLHEFWQNKWHINYKKALRKSWLIPFCILFNNYKYLYRYRLFWNIVKITAIK